MTCVVAYVDKGGAIWMGGDSMATDNNQALNLATPKVFTKGKLVLGAVGTIRIGSILRYSFKPPRLPRLGSDLPAWINGPFMEAYRACLKEHGYMSTEKDQEQGATLLVGIRGRVFFIDDNHSVMEMREPYASTGTGGEAACGAIYALLAAYGTARAREPLSGEQVVRLALGAAAHHTVHVRPPFEIVHIEAA